MRRRLFLPVALLAVFAGYLGWRAGQPVSETDILEAYAARWVAVEGGEATDCAGQPDPRAEVRMVVRCERGGRAMVWYVDARGRDLALQAEPGA